jgi:hypothetical protein
MEINAYSIYMDKKNRKEPTWKEALREAGKQTKKRLSGLESALLGKELQCPYCEYSTRDKEDLHDHLTYYHWMSVPAVEEIISEKRK